MVWKFCEIRKSYGKRGPEGPKFCEILSHSVKYGMYDNNIYFQQSDQFSSIFPSRKLPPEFGELDYGSH